MIMLIVYVCNILYVEKFAQFISELDLDNDYISAVNTHMRYSDYQHSEIHSEGDGHEGEEHEEEEHEEGTEFTNITTQVRVDVIHAELFDWKSAASLAFKDTDFEAIGEEEFPRLSKH